MGEPTGVKTPNVSNELRAILVSQIAANFYQKDEWRKYFGPVLEEARKQLEPFARDYSREVKNSSDYRVDKAPGKLANLRGLVICKAWNYTFRRCTYTILITREGRWMLYNINDDEITLDCPGLLLDLVADVQTTDPIARLGGLSLFLDACDGARQQVIEEQYRRLRDLDADCALRMMRTNLEKGKLGDTFDFVYAAQK